MNIWCNLIWIVFCAAFIAWAVNRPRQRQFTPEEHRQIDAAHKAAAIGKERT